MSENKTNNMEFSITITSEKLTSEEKKEMCNKVMVLPGGRKLQSFFAKNGEKYYLESIGLSDYQIFDLVENFEISENPKV